MSDLLDRLQSALKDRYEIVRQIGRGGMAMVFLAQDLKHGRRVALKVLHPELAAVVGTERFLREIQLSAQLEHPNILTLIDSGDADGLPYYVMPYVEGESLRDRLEREGHLAIPEAVAIAAEVADGLDHAHRRGVIHRDVKPANILLSEGHALVADFGVARALDEAGGERVTMTGLAVGSPVYMSPEQAAGEETAEPTDVYSLGCVLYEMLAGEPPFSGQTARALLSQHSLERASPVEQRRAEVPEALAVVVARCLAKEPADRFESAAELKKALREPGASELKGWRRILAVLAGVWVAALATVLCVVFREGMPYWLLAVAGVLLAVQGVFVAGARRRRRAMGDGPASGGRRRMQIRLGGVLMGGAGLAVLGVGSAALVGLGALGVGPMSTLVSRGEIEFKPMVVVADFESPPDYPDLGRSIAKVLRADMGTADALDIVDSESIRRTLQTMKRQPDDPVDREVATEIAVRSGAEAVLLGAVLRIGTGYRLVVKLLSMPTEAQLLELSESAASADKVIPATDRLWKRLMRELGEPARSIRRRPDPLQLTTSSLEALLKVEQAAVRLESDQDPLGAIQLLEEAVDLDPEFAQAWMILAEFLHFAAEFRREAEALDMACSLLDRIMGQERATLEFQCLARAGRREEALQLASAARERFGSITGAAVYHTEFLMRWGLWEDAAISAAQILQWYVQERDSLEAIGEWDREDMAGSIFRNNLRNSLLALHRFREADSVNAAYPYWGPDGVWPIDLFQHAFASRGYDRAEAALDSRRAAEGEEFRGWHWYAQTAMAEGRLSDFETYLARLHPVRAAFYGADLARFRDDAEPLAAALERVTAEESLEEWSERDLLLLARNWVSVRRPDRARQVLDAYEVLFPETDRNLISAYGTASADLAAAEGRPLEAIDAYLDAFAIRPSAEDHGWETYFRVGLAYEAAGMPDSAIAAYERAVAYPGWQSYMHEYYTLALSTERLAVLYDTVGDTASALENYRLLTGLWEEADPELQPRVEGARQRIRELELD
jgi:tRNA A-37 threonylcarbamoyl transferase component Bud32/tetratricopeptide (TPR) repeat protein